MKTTTKKQNIETVHIHKVVVTQKSTYESVRKRYANHIDEKGMINVEALKSVRQL